MRRFWARLRRLGHTLLWDLLAGPTGASSSARFFAGGSNGGGLDDSVIGAGAIDIPGALLGGPTAGPTALALAASVPLPAVHIIHEAVALSNDLTKVIVRRQDGRWEFLHNANQPPTATATLIWKADGSLQVRNLVATLVSPNGTAYQLGVSDAGGLTTTQV